MVLKIALCITLFLTMASFAGHRRNAVKHAAPGEHNDAACIKMKAFGCLGQISLWAALTIMLVLLDRREDLEAPIVVIGLTLFILGNLLAYRATLRARRAAAGLGRPEQALNAVVGHFGAWLFYKFVSLLGFILVFLACLGVGTPS